MIQIRYVLRNLPGIGDVESLLKKIQAHPNPAWAPENDQLPGLLNRISLRLFGITADDTEFDYTGLPPEEWHEAIDAWEENFLFAEYYFDDLGDDAEQDATALAIWETLGWDVTDGLGKVLGYLTHFDRQIICASKGLKGRLPNEEPSDEEAAEAAKRWANALLAGKRARRG